MTDAAGWAWLFLLGAFHGINPGMGWLFAVALGMQEHSARAVLRALVPITLGHALAIGVVVLIASLIQIVRSVELRQDRGGLLAAGHGDLSRHSQPAFPMGRHACWISGTHRMVIPDGVRARRRIDGAAGGDANGTDASHARRRDDGAGRHAGPHARVSHRNSRCGNDRLPKSGSRDFAEGLVQSWIWFGRLR